MDKDARIYVAGHRGLVGSAIARRLRDDGCTRVITRARAECDLTDRGAVDRLFADERPQYVFLAAAKVGGIAANDAFPADFIRENLLIEAYVIDAAQRHGVRKLQFLGSSCIYPKLAPQPIREEYLLSGPLEPTNEAYALAKIAGIYLCRAYRRQHGLNAIALMPTNLYGPGDNFDAENSHVLPALVRRFHEAKVADAPSVTIWGTGTPRREFLFVDDLADAAVMLMRDYDEAEIVNVGTGEDVTILELSEIVRAAVGYSGEIVLDRTRPDGTPRKLLDVSRLFDMGWRPRVSLADGIARTYAWYLLNQQSQGLRVQ